METEALKCYIGTKIAEYRKMMNWTQAELADRINYTDKAVSKWERGESIPDVPTLLLLSGLFGVSVDSLLGKDAPSADVPKQTRSRAIYKGVLGLSTLLVWFLALLVYVVLSSIGIPKSWISFIYAVPINAITLLVLSSTWRDFRWNALHISVVVWGVLVGIYASLYVFAHVNVWRLFLLGVLGQLAVFLWFRMLRGEK